MASSEFAQRQLAKHGWKKGAGLGKNETGITEAIKVKIKADKAGVGTDPGEQFTFHWWDHAFNKAANGITVENTQDGVKVKSSSDKRTPIQTKKTAMTLDNKSMLYGRFIKSATLTPEGLQGIGDDGTSSDSSSAESDSDNPEDKFKVLTDEQLFKACGGLTAHKAARHGHKLNGKLRRIEEQEKQLLRNIGGDGDSKPSDEMKSTGKSNSCKKKKKKKKAKKRKREDKADVGESSGKSEESRRKKRKNADSDSSVEINAHSRTRRNSKKLKKRSEKDAVRLQIPS